MNLGLLILEFVPPLFIVKIIAASLWTWKARYELQIMKF